MKFTILKKLRIPKRELRVDESICEYVEWKEEKISSISAHNDKQILIEFLSFCGKKDLYEIEYADVEAYRSYLAESTSSKFRVIQGIKAINNFLRYAQARKKKCITPVTFKSDELLLKSLEMNMSREIKQPKRRVGRPSIDPEIVAKVKFLKENKKHPLSYRQIARALSRDVGQIHRIHQQSKEVVA